VVGADKVDIPEGTEVVVELELIDAVKVLV
jgi:hypothetical protein